MNEDIKSSIKVAFGLLPIVFALTFLFFCLDLYITGFDVADHPSVSPDGRPYIDADDYTPGQDIYGEYLRVGTDTVMRSDACTLYGTNLSLGSTGLGVQVLQIFLNTDPATQVAASGPGSPGHETNYFGSMTFSAVERFQEKYALDILIPLGLTHPTGYVGSATRKELSSLCGPNL